MRTPSPNRRPRRAAPGDTRDRGERRGPTARTAAPVSRRQERAQRPWPASQSHLPDVTLIIGAGALLFIPLLSPATLLLSPVAWALGAWHARQARREGREPSSTSELGKSMGRFVSLLFLIPASAGLIVGSLIIISELMRR